MKLYRINGKVYELKRGNGDTTMCRMCVLYGTGKIKRCPSEKLLEKCSRLGWNTYFVEYKGNIEGVEIIELVKEKMVYKRMHKGFTRRDVLRELILELKEKLGVDIVRKCDSVEQCKDVINEIIKIACNCELSYAKDLTASKDTVIEKLKSEYDDLRARYQVDLSTNKEEIKRLNAVLENTEQSRIEWLQKCKSIEKELSTFKSDNEILGMWLREAEDRGVLSLIAFKAKRMFDKIFGNGYDK